MSAVASEIASQPQCWARAVELATSEAAVALPAPGERVAVVGCGTSYFIGQVYATLRERADLGLTDAFAASEMPPDRRYDRVLAISRSGTTTEVLDLLRAVNETAVTTAITAVPSTPISDAAQTIVDLSFADEQAVVQTRFATSALALLRANLGEDLSDAIADADRTVDAPLPDGALDYQQFTFLGRGPTVGLAHEAALKLREASLSWSESYPAMEYRHGPISIADPHSMVWAFGEVPAGLQDQVTGTGARFVHDPDVDPMAELIRAQRLAVELATARGLDPDLPRNLTRSVVLG